QDQLDRLETEDVAGVVLRLCDFVCTLSVDDAGDDELAVRRYRIVGRQRARRLGHRHSQLRLVDRNRSRGNTDLRDPAFAATTLAYVDQPLRRSDDAFRSGPGRHVSHLPPRTSVADVLAVPVSEHDGDLAAVSQPVDVGRLRSFNLRNSLGNVL